ncbi:MAG: hypothetical protein IJ547_05780, partial [Clostridia bacterium]|nr:hypothetical protein [Clostridia bacterium]
MSLFKKNTLAEELAKAEEEYSEAAEAVETLETATVEGELDLNAAEAPEEPSTVVRKGVSFLYELVSVLMVAAVMTAVLFTFLYRFSGVVGESM